MAEISLSKLFKSQIHDQRITKINAVKITRSFKRVERMLDDMSRHGFDMEQMILKIKIIENIVVVFNVQPKKGKIIVKKILFK